jgi:(Z)-2-((N-methylformamido)methylene)-5-hydroxybutyrolactone dehydrogenase
VTSTLEPQPDICAYEMYIGGESAPSGSGKVFTSTDPYRGVEWATAPDGDLADVDRAVGAARDALDGPWGELAGSERARLMRRLAALIDRDAPKLAAIETRDNGKLLRETTVQMRAVAEHFYYFAGLADKVQGESIPTGKSNYLVYTRLEPAGVVAAITPWNSPLLLMAWKLAPALAAGCTMVVKPSDFTPISTLEFGKLVHEAEFPPGVFNVVTGLGPTTGAALAGHGGVDRVAFTGSTTTGIAVGHAAMQNLNGVSLELGGKSAQLVFPDADLEAAANGIIAGVFAATGQTCMAGSRVLVHEDVHDELLERITAKAATIKLGDPTDAATEMGPIANRAQFDRVLHFIASAVGDGATIAHGGQAESTLGGLFVQPTVISDASPDMAVVQEEVFGPVVAVLKFRNEAEAVAMANASQFGLAASVWTKEVHRAHRVAAALQAGTVWINAYRVVAASVPFGGFKMSGIGRENGMDAVKSFTETKSFWVELSGELRDPFVIG